MVGINQVAKRKVRILITDYGEYVVNEFYNEVRDIRAAEYGIRAAGVGSKRLSRRGVATAIRGSDGQRYAFVFGPFVFGKGRADIFNEQIDNLRIGALELSALPHS